MRLAEKMNKKGTDLGCEWMTESAVPACDFYVKRGGKRKIKDVLFVLLCVVFCFGLSNRVGWLVE